jgi:hypothetical protein
MNVDGCLALTMPAAARAAVDAEFFLLKLQKRCALGLLRGKTSAPAVAEPDFWSLGTF